MHLEYCWRLIAHRNYNSAIYFGYLSIEIYYHKAGFADIK